MKRNFLHALLLAAAVVGLSSCGDDDDVASAGSFTYDGSSKNIAAASGFFDEDGSEDADGKKYYSHYLSFADVSFTTTSGKASVFYLDFYSSATTIADGTYTIVDSQTSNKALQIEGTFELDFTINGENTTGGTSYEITSGTATVKKSGDSYTIDFTGKAVVEGEAASTAKDVKLHYNGVPQIF